MTFEDLREEEFDHPCVFISCRLSSGRPKWMPWWVWYHINTFINYILCLPLCITLRRFNYQIVQPGLWGKRLIKKYNLDEAQFLLLWQELIEKDAVIVVKGWRAEKSQGARGELAAAKIWNVPVLSWQSGWRLSTILSRNGILN